VKSAVEVPQLWHFVSLAAETVLLHIAVCTCAGERDLHDDSQTH